jgi:hypothetical protein
MKMRPYVPVCVSIFFWARLPLIDAADGADNDGGKRALVDGCTAHWRFLLAPVGHFYSPGDLGISLSP